MALFGGKKNQDEERHPSPVRRGARALARASGELSVAAAQQAEIKLIQSDITTWAITLRKDCKIPAADRRLADAKNALAKARTATSNDVRKSHISAAREHLKAVRKLRDQDMRRSAVRT